MEFKLGVALILGNLGLVLHTLGSIQTARISEYEDRDKGFLLAFIPSLVGSAMFAACLLWAMYLIIMINKTTTPVLDNANSTSE